MEDFIISVILGILFTAISKIVVPSIFNIIRALIPKYKDSVITDKSFNLLIVFNLIICIIECFAMLLNEFITLSAFFVVVIINIISSVAFLYTFTDHDKKEIMPKNKTVSKKEKIKKNKQQFLRISENFINDHTHEVLSCHDELMKEITEYCNKNEKEFEEWDFNFSEYQRSAIAVIANLTFDMLASGRYHLYKGVLNPMKCTSDLKNIYNASLKWGVENNVITQEEMEEQQNLLRSRINDVG